MRVIEASVQLPVDVKQKGKLWISRCEVLDVCSQGPDKKKALANLVEALQLFLESCFERGTLDQVLHERGFRPLTGGTPKRSRKSLPPTSQLVKVPPLPFMIPDPEDTRCRA